jgi:hypothetical protein
METEKSNIWISFTYKAKKISKQFKKVDKNINISFKTNNKLNNIKNKIEYFNIYDLKGI